MISKTVHLIAQTVAKGVASAIVAAPEYPHQAVFSIPSYRRQLIARVVICLHDRYAVGNSQPENQQALLHLLEQPRVIGPLVQGHMARALVENWGWADSSQMPDSSPVFYAVATRDFGFQ